MIQNIAIPLESGKDPFKLSLYFRDFVPGARKPEQIVNTVKSSRRTICILSPDFVTSEWARFELRFAVQQRLSDKKNRVLMIMYEDIGPIDTLEAELRAYLKINIYLKWGDNWFWDKLLYAMPHKIHGSFKEICNNINLKNT